MCGLMEEKVYAAAFDQLMSERRNVTGDIKEVCDQRDEVIQQIQAKIAVLLDLILKVHRRCARASQFLRDIFGVTRLVLPREHNSTDNL